MAHESPFPDAIPFRTLDRVSGAVTGVLALLVLIGVVAAFLAVGGDDPARFWGAFLFNWLFWSSLAMGMVMFAVALHLTNADWAWSVRRFALGGVAFLPISFVLLPLIFFGADDIFHHWLHAEHDPVIDAKRAWLNLPGMVTRDLLAVAVLYGLALLFAYLSLRPDVYGAGRTDRHRSLYQRLTGGWRGAEAEARRSHGSLNRLGVILGLLYAILWGMIAIDLAMSLEPHWFSTMFPVIFFVSAFHGGIAVTTIAISALRRPAAVGDFITPRQFHDIGKLLFAFSVFWMYVNWSQYIVIWYAQLPLEQRWLAERLADPYGALTMGVVVLVFLLPFFGLLTRPPKRVPAILSFFAVLILVGHWLELFLFIHPSMFEGETAVPFGLPEIGIGLGFAGLFLLAYLWFLRSFPLLPSPATLAARGSAVVAVPATAPEA